MVRNPRFGGFDLKMIKQDANKILGNEGSERLREMFDEMMSYHDADPMTGHGADPDQSRDDESMYKGDERKAPRLQTICLREFAQLKLPPRKMVLDPILPQKGLGMLFAGRGIGKTHTALGMAYAVSCGGEFLRWHAEKPRNVLYVDGEMPQQALQERLSAMMDASDKKPEDGAFRLLCMDRQELGFTLNLANPKHQAVLDRHLDDVGFLVLDNLSTLMNGGPENDAEWQLGRQPVVPERTGKANDSVGNGPCGFRKIMSDIFSDSIRILVEPSSKSNEFTCVCQSLQVD